MGGSVDLLLLFDMASPESLLVAFDSISVIGGWDLGFRIGDGGWMGRRIMWWKTDGSVRLPFLIVVPRWEREAFGS